MLPSYSTYGYHLIVISILQRLFYAIKRKKKRKNKETNSKMSLKKRKREGEKYTTG